MSFSFSYISRGVDVPGSLFAPFGLGYFDPFYMSMFLGNYADFMEITSSMTKQQLDKALRHYMAAITVFSKN